METDKGNIKRIKTGGRQKGAPNKATAFRQQRIAESGITPLDYLLRVMRDESLPDRQRIDADQLYKQGAMTGIRAIFLWSENRGNVSILFKVTGVDFQGNQPSLFKVANAFAAIKGVPAENTPLQCEDKLSFCAAYWMPKSAFLLAALGEGNLCVGFNRQPGGFDITFPIDGSPSKAKDADSYIAFQRCTAEIFAAK